MQARIIKNITSLAENRDSLSLVDLTTPQPGPEEVPIEVSACGACHTKLDEIEGRTAPPALPVLPGHLVVGRMAKLGEDAARFQGGDRVEVGWIHSVCEFCGHCQNAEDNLCLVSEPRAPMSTAVMPSI